MRINVTETMFIRAFADYGREDNFSRDGLIALYEYFTEFERDTGGEFELDVIALCCDFSEYKSFQEFQEQYSDEFEDVDNLRDYTQVIEFGDGALIIQDF